MTECKFGERFLHKIKNEIKSCDGCNKHTRCHGQHHFRMNYLNTALRKMKELKINRNILHSSTSKINEDVLSRYSPSVQEYIIKKFEHIPEFYIYMLNKMPNCHSVGSEEPGGGRHNGIITFDMDDIYKGLLENKYKAYIISDMCGSLPFIDLYQDNWTLKDHENTWQVDPTIETPICDDMPIIWKRVLHGAPQSYINIINKAKELGFLCFMDPSWVGEKTLEKKWKKTIFKYTFKDLHNNNI
jgi:hypothetical protein